MRAHLCANVPVCVCCVNLRADCETDASLVYSHYSRTSSRSSRSRTTWTRWLWYLQSSTTQHQILPSTSPPTSLSGCGTTTLLVSHAAFFVICLPPLTLHLHVMLPQPTLPSSFFLMAFPPHPNVLTIPLTPCTAVPTVAGDYGESEEQGGDYYTGDDDWMSDELWY